MGWCYRFLTAGVLTIALSLGLSTSLNSGVVTPPDTITVSDSDTREHPPYAFMLVGKMALILLLFPNGSNSTDIDEEFMNTKKAHCKADHCAIASQFPQENSH